MCHCGLFDGSRCGWDTQVDQGCHELPVFWIRRIKQPAVINSKSVDPFASSLNLRNTAFETERDQISQNIEAVLEFYRREEQKVSHWQRILERISLVIGQPVFIGFILLFVSFWILVNIVLRQFGMAEFDSTPFFWLQGIVGLGALLTTIVILTKQNRLSKLEERRAHLDMKVTLLTEQKAAKLIDLLEKLRRDLPNVRNHNDLEAAALQQSMNPDLVLAALDERSESNEQLKSVGEAKQDVEAEIPPRTK